MLFSCQFVRESKKKREKQLFTTQNMKKKLDFVLFLNKCLTFATVIKDRGLWKVVTLSVGRVKWQSYKDVLTLTVLSLSSSMDEGVLAKPFG